MPQFSAVKDMDEAMPRLANWIKASGQPLRGICEQTQVLDAPERMQHGNLSKALRRKGNLNLYLQQVVVLCKLINMPAAALLLNIDDPRVAKDAVKMAKAYAKLPDVRRQHLLSAIEAEAGLK